MPGARANWYVDQPPALDGPDPFEVPIEDVGELIDLSKPTAQLTVRLTELLNREGRLEAIGVTCDLKSRSDVVCSACPISRAGDPTAPLGALCRVGREQESVCTQLAVQGQHEPSGE